MFSKLLALLGFRGREMQIERRRDRRFRATNSFVLDFQKRFQKSVKRGDGRNISLGGVRFATSFYMRRGEKIDLTLKFTDKYKKTRRLKVKAKIVNFGRPRGANRYRAGCKFIDLKEPARSELQEFLDWLEKRAEKQEIIRK